MKNHFEHTGLENSGAEDRLDKGSELKDFRLEKAENSTGDPEKGPIEVSPERKPEGKVQDHIPDGTEDSRIPPMFPPVLHERHNPDSNVDDNGKPYRTEDGGLLPNNTYELDGTIYETDDEGSIYRVDGEYYSDDRFVIDGEEYYTDENGNVIPKDASEAQEENREQKTENSEKNPPIQNKQDGLAREHDVEKDLHEQYPEEEGYEIVSEAYLRDKDGNIVKDKETGEARRIDFVVVKDGKVVDSIEVTSKTADKTAQCAKESRIRESGGNYIKDSNGNLVEIPADVQTRIERRD